MGGLFGGGGGGEKTYADYGPKPEGMQRLENGLYDYANSALDMFNSPITQNNTPHAALGTNQSWGWGINTGQAPRSGYSAPQTGTQTNVQSGVRDYTPSSNGFSALERTQGSADQRPVQQSQTAPVSTPTQTNWLSPPASQQQSGPVNGYGQPIGVPGYNVPSQGQPEAAGTARNPNLGYQGPEGRWVMSNPASGGGGGNQDNRDAQYVWMANQNNAAGQQQQTQQATGPREPTLMELLMQDALNKQLAGSERYDNLTADAAGLSSGAKNALTQAETAGDWYFDQAKGNYSSATSTLDQARTAGDPWYAQADAAFGKANGLIDQQVDQLNYSKEGNIWYDNYVRDQLGQAASMTSSGEIPKAFEDALMGTINRGLESSMGQMINDMAGRGVINSSVSTTGMNALGQQAANAYQDAYMENFMNLLGGIQGNAAQGTAAGDTFGRTNLNIAAGYGDAAGNATNLGNSYANTGSMRTNDLVNVAGGYTNNANGLMGAGSQRINDWLGINKGYNDTLNQNLMERQYLNSAVPQYWTNAMGPFSMVPGLLGQQQQDFWNTGKQTTVVG